VTQTPIRWIGREARIVMMKLASRFPYEQIGMITMIASYGYPIDKGPDSNFVRQVIVVLKDHIRGTILAMSDRMTSCFATFANVPYQDPLSRQQWEQFWEMEPYKRDR
jgi:hypothetical protein